MQCWYWATLGVGSVVAQTANAAAVIARRIGFSLFQAFPSASKSAQVHGRIQATRVSIRRKQPLRLLTIPRSPFKDHHPKILAVRSSTGLGVSVTRLASVLTCAPL